MIEKLRHPGLSDPARDRIVPEATPSPVTPSRAGRWTPERVRGDGGRPVGARRFLALATVLALAACGKAAGLAPAPGERLPVAPRGATATPTPDQLLARTQQQRPQRSDDLLQTSQERRSDEFDIPPK